MLLELWATVKFLEEEIENIKAVFYHQNNYPLWVIDKIITEMKEKLKVTKVVNDESGDKIFSFFSEDSYWKV